MNTQHQTMVGKVALVTGGTGGIGRETALGLASLGATVVIVGKDRARGEAAVGYIREGSGSQKVCLMTADLSSQAQVHRLAQHYQSEFSRLDVLVNNVAGVFRHRQETVDGLEATFALGHLAPFLLTNLLLPALQASAPARIVNLVSDGHRMAALDFDDLQAEHWYRGVDIYMRTKLANVLFTYELALRLEGSGITANAADPGSADTNLMRSTTPDMLPPMIRLMWPVISRTLGIASQAAQSSIYLASALEMDGVTGQYVSPKLQPVEIFESLIRYRNGSQALVAERAADRDQRCGRSSTGCGSRCRCQGKCPRLVQVARERRCC